MPLGRKKTKSRPSEQPSPHDVYLIRCYCGHQLSGQRSTSSQTVTCPECDELNYVMAQDIYPRPSILSKQIEESPDQTQTTVAKPSDLKVTEIEEPGRLAEPLNDTPPRVWIDEPKGARTRKRIFQLSAIIGGLLLITILALSNRKSRGDYEEQYLTQSSEAWKHVLASKWDQAEEAALLSVEAADHLDRNDESAESLRHLSQEIEILNSLSSYSVIEIVLGQSSLREESSSGNWEELFRARYGGRWLLLQGTVVRDVGEDETKYSLESPMDLPGQQVEMVWDEPVDWFDDLNWDENRCDVFLAVELVEARSRAKNQKRWEMVLSSDNAKLWRTPVLLEKVFGYPLSGQSDDPFVSLVLSQSRQPTDLFKDEDSEQ